MNTYTFLADWTDEHGICFPPVVIADGNNELDARHNANEVATRALAEHITGLADLFDEDGFVVAVFAGDVSGLLVSTHSVIDARTGEAEIRL